MTLGRKQGLLGAVLWAAMGSQVAACSVSASFSAGGKDADEPKAEPSTSASAAPAKPADTATPDKDQPASEDKGDKDGKDKPKSDTKKDDKKGDDKKEGESPAASTPATDAPASTVKARGDTLLLPGNLVFETGSAKLEAGPANEEILGQLKNYLVANAQVTKLRIEGHTDNTGKPEANLKLSGERALTIKKWLVDKGIVESRLLAVGFGQDKPIADNTTEEGRAQNRRTQFKIAELSGKHYKDPLGGGTEFK